MTGRDDRRGAFNYLRASVLSSLYRNGRVLTRRDSAGSDAGTEGVDLEERTMTVHNGRRLGETNRRTLGAHGFELAAHRSGRPELDFFDHREVVDHYYPECLEFVSERTGASHVFAFDHNIRSAAGKSSSREIRGGQQVQGPAHVVHGDYTLRSAPERIQQLAKPPGGNDTFRVVLEPGESLIDPEAAAAALAPEGRFAIINVWRNIAPEPVATHPLALCDGLTVAPADLVVFEIHYQDRVGENYFAKHAPNHGWYFYPEMTRDEVLLIKQWDSAGVLARSAGQRGDDAASPCTFSFHTAFDDPNTPEDAPERWSIEVRCAVLYA